MARVFENWERLVRSTLRNEHLHATDEVATGIAGPDPLSLRRIAKIERILQASDDIEDEDLDVARILCENAFRMVQNLDPSSEGRGVLQFKTGLITISKNKRISKKGPTDRQHDIEHLWEFYLGYKRRHQLTDIQREQQRLMEFRTFSTNLERIVKMNKVSATFGALLDVLEELVRDADAGVGEHISKELNQYKQRGLEPYLHNRCDDGNRGQSYQPTSEEKQAECSNDSQISNFRDEWSSLEVPYSDIDVATNGLSESSKIGKGGYGTVFKGKLGRAMVAIKVLDSTSKQGQKEFFQELEALKQMRHPNLVKLVGACFEVRALVYEYLPNGSLEDCLKDSPCLLTWKMRTRIIYEICRALIYLHSRSVVHGDLKPANILLDANFKCKLSDFGLCRFLPEDMTTAVYLETVPKGTSGYIDPWYFETGILRPGSDLYSFGITILKLLTGLPPIGLGRKARDADENLFQEMIDPTAGSWPFELAKELLYWSLQSCYHSERSSELLEDMSTCLKDMLDEIETLQEGKFKVVVRQQEAAEDPFMVEEKKKPVVIMVLKFHMHSEAYAQEIKERILSVKGVQSVKLALKASEVSVMGIFHPMKLVEYVRRKTGKHVAIVKVEQLYQKLEEEEKPKEEEKETDEKKDVEEAVEPTISGLSSWLERTALRNSVEEVVEPTISGLSSWLERTALRNSVSNNSAGYSNNDRTMFPDDDAQSCSFETDNDNDSKVREARVNACRLCGEKDVCVLLLPCRHLCVCMDCDPKVITCPICDCIKHASVMVNMS